MGSGPPDARENSPRRPFLVRAWPEIAGAVVALLWCGAIAQAALRLPEDRVLMGFTHIDQPVYYACAREYFENGNGLFAASPYSSDPSSPRLYSHLGFILAGWFWRLTGCNFGSIDFWGRMIFGTAMMALGARVAHRLTEGCRFQWFAVLATVAASGLAWAVALWNLLIGFALEHGQPGFNHSLGAWLGAYPDAVQSTEGGYGEWGASLARNLPSTPETFYHTLFFAAMLAFLAGRRAVAVFILFLAWWAHPFTGLELGLILTCGALVEWFVARRGGGEDRPAMWALTAAASTGITVAFLSWYLFYMPRFPEHASVEANFRGFHNPMRIGFLLIAFGLFALLPVAAFASAGFRSALGHSRPTRIAVVWLVCVLGLVFHDRLAPLIPTIQPMHFMRGYLYVPLAVLGALGLGALATRWNWTPRVATVAGGFILLVHLPDNWFAMRALQADLGLPHSVFSITRRAAGALARLDSVEPTGTVISLDAPADLVHALPLVPVLTHHRPLMVHQFNTPNWDEKRDAVAGWKGQPTEEQLDEFGVSLLLAQEGSLESSLNQISAQRLTTASAEGGIAIMRVSEP